jgi:hypothetical protein
MQIDPFFGVSVFPGITPLGHPQAGADPYERGAKRFSGHKKTSGEKIT